MVKRLTLIIVLLISRQILGQVDVSAEMGLNYFAASSFNDYINGNFAGAENQLSTFQSSVEFVGEADYTWNEHLQLGLEYALSIYSFNSGATGLGLYNVEFEFHKPSIVAYYLISGEGYKFKFGGGIGWRYVALNEKLPNYPTAGHDYTASGFGAVLKSVGFTALGKNLYAVISLRMRYDLPGEPVDAEGVKIKDNADETNVNLDSVSFGLSLGIAYSF